MATAQLFLWSAARGEWRNCPPDEIAWLDRSTLSDNADLTLHRTPRCPGFRYVHHRWELFSRDTTYPVYLAPDVAGTALRAEEVQRMACRVLPLATARYEPLPVTLEEGLWLVSVGAWVVRLRLDVPARPGADPAAPDRDADATTTAVDTGRRDGAPGDDAVARVRGYFQRNATARLTMAYYYQEFILGRPAPQTVPMMNVVIALNLSGEGAVSDYKKLLQGFIWSERGHARDLVGFLLASGLLTLADLDEAKRVAADNERYGVCEMARQRLQYRPKGAGALRHAGFRGGLLPAGLRGGAVDPRVNTRIVEGTREDGHCDRAGLAAAADGPVVIAALPGSDRADDQPYEQKRRSDMHFNLRDVIFSKTRRQPAKFPITSSADYRISQRLDDI